MIGKDVHVSLVSETEVHTPLGTLPARVFRLFPGGALVWGLLGQMGDQVRRYERAGACHGLVRTASATGTLPRWRFH